MQERERERCLSPSRCSFPPFFKSLPSKKQNKKTQKLKKQVLQYSNEKAQLAQQIYDHVDSKIRRLDMDLAAFDAELARERVGHGLPEYPPPAPFLAAVGGMGAGGAGGGAGGAGGARRKSGGRKSAAQMAAEQAAEQAAAAAAAAAAASSGAGGAAGGASAAPGGFLGAPGLPGSVVGGTLTGIPYPADPSEPVYCYCQRVSYGDMVRILSLFSPHFLVFDSVLCPPRRKNSE